MLRPLYEELIPYYEIIEGRDWNREIGLLLSILKRQGASSVVDLGCGTGFHVRALALGGFDAIGVDISRPNIRFARSKARQEGINPHFIVGSYYRYRPPKEVDAALCLNWSIPTRNDEMRRFLSNTRSLLRMGGILVIDYERVSEIVWQDVGRAFTTSWNLNGLVIVRVSVAQLASNVLHSKDVYILFSKSKLSKKRPPDEVTRYRATGNSSSAQVYIDCSYVRFFSITDLRRFAHETGFRLIEDHVLPRNGYKRHYAVLKRIT